MKIIRTYPPDIEERRQRIHRAIDREREALKERLLSRDPQAAIQPLLYRETVRLELRAYTERLEPYWRMLAELETFATITIVVPREDVLDGVIDRINERLEERRHE